MDLSGVEGLGRAAQTLALTENGEIFSSGLVLLPEIVAKQKFQNDTSSKPVAEKTVNVSVECADFSHSWVP